jgi:hypothetical protein
MKKHTIPGAISWLSQHMVAMVIRFDVENQVVERHVVEVTYCRKYKM